MVFIRIIGYLSLLQEIKKKIIHPCDVIFFTIEAFSLNAIKIL